MRIISGIQYAGSKWTNAEDIVTKLPSATMLIDMFAGSGALSVYAKQSGKYHTVVANDVNNRLIRMLRTVRDRPDEVCARIKQTPVGRYEFDMAREQLDDEDDIIAAVAVLFVTRFGAKFLPIDANGYRLPKVVAPVVNSPESWHRSADFLKETQKLMIDIAYDNLDWKELAKKYDRVSSTARKLGNNILYLCDPPYKETASRYEQDFDHKEFLTWAMKAKDDPNISVAVLDRASANLDLPGFEQHPIRVIRSSARKVVTEDTLYISKASSTLPYSKASLRRWN